MEHLLMKRSGNPVLRTQKSGFPGLGPEPSIIACLTEPLNSPCVLHRVNSQGRDQEAQRSGRFAEDRVICLFRVGEAAELEKTIKAGLRSLLLPLLLSSNNASLRRNLRLAPPPSVKVSDDHSFISPFVSHINGIFFPISLFPQWLSRPSASNHAQLA
jgi:hypothetical protein